MHIPDNYLSPQTDAVLAAVMVPVWVRCARVVRERLDRRHLSFLGMAAAFSFLLMMFNVPLPGGTTGHAVGGTLVALLLGPEAACLAVSVALAIQALVFGDGGLLAFGANCLNMAFVLPFVGWGVARLVRGGSTSPVRRRVAAAVGAYVGLAVAALCAAVEFGIQPMLFSDAAGNALFCPYGLGVAVPAMMVPHLLAACVVEAVSTVAIYEFVLRCAPDLVVGDDVARPAAPASGSRGLARVAMLVGALAVATPLGRVGHARLLSRRPSRRRGLRALGPHRRGPSRHHLQAGGPDRPRHPCREVRWPRRPWRQGLACLAPRPHPMRACPPGWTRPPRPATCRRATATPSCETTC